MAKKDAPPPLELYIAAYPDSSSAEEVWNALKQSAHDKSIAVEALALVNRDDDGKVHVKDTTRETGVGAAIGAVGGAVVGLIFPPALIASAVVGAGIGLEPARSWTGYRSRRSRRTSSGLLNPASQAS